MNKNIQLYHPQTRLVVLADRRDGMLLRAYQRNACELAVVLSCEL